MNPHHAGILFLSLVAGCASAPAEESAASAKQECHVEYRVGSALPVKTCSVMTAEERQEVEAAQQRAVDAVRNDIRPGVIRRVEGSEGRGSVRPSAEQCRSDLTSPVASITGAQEAAAVLVSAAVKCVELRGVVQRAGSLLTTAKDLTAVARVGPGEWRLLPKPDLENPASARLFRRLKWAG